jgi:hypothetical protein
LYPPAPLITPLYSFPDNFDLTQATTSPPILLFHFSLLSSRLSSSARKIRATSRSATAKLTTDGSAKTQRQTSLALCEGFLGGERAKMRAMTPSSWGGVALGIARCDSRLGRSVFPELVEKFG